MKKEYIKPELDLIDLRPKEALMDDILPTMPFTDSNFKDAEWDISKNFNNWD